MAIEFKLPDIGEGVAEGEIVKWLVREGDQLTEDQPMVEVMTDKATVEITSPHACRVQKILHQEGELVPVQTAIVLLETEAGTSSSAPPSGAPARGETTPPAPAPALSRNGGQGKVLATPATRKRARDLGLDLASISGSGPRGRIQKEDLERALAARQTAPSAAAAATARPLAPAPPPPPPRHFAAGSEETIPYRGLRRAVGEQMVRSAFTAPHFTLVEEMDLGNLASLLKRTAPVALERGVKLTYLPYIVKALIAAIRRHPSINAHMNSEASEITIKRDVHVGIATDTERGLIVPVVKHADQKSTLEIAADIARLAREGRAQRLSREELTGSTITITSAGSIGGLFATPILNHPEVAILGVYQIKDKPVVREGQVVPGKVGCLSLTLDHRVVDGGTAARVMSFMKLLLEDPRLLLLEN